MMLRSMAILACTFGAGMLAMTCVRTNTTPVVFLPPPIAPVHVAVHVPPPPPPPPPPLPAPPAPLPETPAPPRAQNPLINAACVMPTQTEPTPQCAWDDGFPAISADGRTVAMKYVPSDGPRGNTSLTIRFLDVASSRVVRDDVILTGDETLTEIDPAKLQIQIAQRVMAIQPRLAHYRTLAALGSGRAFADEPPQQHGIHAEFADELVRIVDPATNRVLWQAQLDGSPAAPVTPRSADDMCGGWGLWSVSAWWDADTKTVLVAQRYHTGGCMCADAEVDHVRRF